MLLRRLLPPRGIRGFLMDVAVNELAWVSLIFYDIWQEEFCVAGAEFGQYPMWICDLHD